MFANNFFSKSNSNSILDLNNCCNLDEIIACKLAEHSFTYELQPNVTKTDDMGQKMFVMNISSNWRESREFKVTNSYLHGHPWPCRPCMSLTDLFWSCISSYGIAWPCIILSYMYSAVKDTSRFLICSTFVSFVAITKDTGWCKSRGTAYSADCSAVVGTTSIFWSQNIPNPLV